VPVFGGEAVLARTTFGQRKSAPVDPPAAPAPAVPTKTIQSFMFRGRVTEDSMKQLGDAMLESTAKDVDEILLLIESDGGQLAPALELHQIMIKSAAVFRTHAVGRVASAATALFLAGSRRTATSTSRFLFHQVTTPLRPAPGTFQARSVERHRGLFELTLHEVYRHRTRLPLDMIEGFAHGEIVLDAATAMRHGVIHGIDDAVTPSSIPGEPRPVI
jgi:ATP-dependent protease ClpP protease subunit